MGHRIAVQHLDEKHPSVDEGEFLHWCSVFNGLLKMGVQAVQKEQVSGLIIGLVVRIVVPNLFPYCSVGMLLVK